MASSERQQYQIGAKEINIFHTVSIFAVGFPPISKFISALPLALICYVLALGMTVSVAMRYKEGKKAMKSLIGGMSPAFPAFSVVKRLLLIFSYGRVYAENTIITIH